MQLYVKNTLEKLGKRILLLLLVLTGCDALDETPFIQASTESYYQDEAAALGALSSAYARLKSGNGYYKQRYLSTLFAASDQGLSTYLYNDFKRGTVTNTDENLTALWKDVYTAIREANNVIANVPTITMNESLQKRIVGEARFLRALHYFNLVRGFGPVPLRLSPVTPGDDKGLPKSSITLIYTEIIKDLEYAALHCWGREETRNDYNNDLGRATNTAAYGLLAKVYLRIASCKRTAIEGVAGNDLYLDFPETSIYYYQLAKENADLALDNTGFALSNSLEDYKTIFDPGNGNNAEMIFDVQGSSIVGQGTAVSNLFCPQNSGLAGSGFGSNNKLKPLFINNRIDKTDPRFQETILKSYENTTRSFEINPFSTGYIPTVLATGNTAGTLWQTWTAKYIDKEATTAYTSQQNWHILRLADVYLIQAEAAVELGQDASLANESINRLRNRVGITDFEGAGMSMEDFRTALLRERAVELYMEGQRFFDLTRMGVYDAYCQTIYGSTDGVRQADDYLWPIPISEIAANDAID